MTNPIAQDLGGVVLLLVPEPKPLPDLLLATYHEARGWNACRDAMLKLISTHSAEIAGALRDAERYRWLRAAHGSMDFGFWHVCDFAGCIIGQQPEELDTAIDSAMQQGGGGE